MTIIHSSIDARDVKPLVGFNTTDSKDVKDLSKIGIFLDEALIGGTVSGMDALPSNITAGVIGTPIQFLQNFLPGFVKDATTKRTIDDLIGITTAGSWEDREVVQGFMERTGKATPYGDKTDFPFSSYVESYETRSIVRFEDGFEINTLEQKQAMKANINPADAKRGATLRALEIVRNEVGFNGYNGGANKTYGFLNDPSIPAYVTVPVGASTTTPWSTKTFSEITKDINDAANSLRVQSGSNVEPLTDKCTLAIASRAVGALSVATDFNVSVRDWLTKTYPNMRIISVPELTGANGGADVFYMYAENIMGDSSDSGKVFDQIVPAKIMNLGSENFVKGIREAYSNATAGVYCKRPFAVVRRTGI